MYVYGASHARTHALPITNQLSTLLSRCNKLQQTAAVPLSRTRTLRTCNNQSLQSGGPVACSSDAAIHGHVRAGHIRCFRGSKEHCNMPNLINLSAPRLQRVRPAFRTRWRHKHSACQHVQKVAGYRPERSLMDCVASHNLGAIHQSPRADYRLLKGGDFRPASSGVV